jgi:hypothetical protein
MKARRPTRSNREVDWIDLILAMRARQPSGYQGPHLSPAPIAETLKVRPLATLGLLAVLVASTHHANRVSSDGCIGPSVNEMQQCEEASKGNHM